MENVTNFTYEFPIRLEGSDVTTRSAARIAKSIENIDLFSIGKAYPGKFVPEYSMFFRKVVDTKKAHYIYFKPNVRDMLSHMGYTDMNSYADIYFNLKHWGRNLGFYRFTTNGEDHHIIIGHQLIMDMKGNILFLGVSKGYQDTPKPEDRKMYVASELYSNEIYKYFIKKFEAEYIDEFRKGGVEIVSKSSLAIEQEYFQEKTVQKFSSLEDFNSQKDVIRGDLRGMNTMETAHDFSRSRMKMASGADARYPSPVLKGYDFYNLKAEITSSTAQAWNQGWARKFLYVIMKKGIDSTTRYYQFHSFLDKMHQTYNPKTGDLLVPDAVPNPSSMKYHPETHVFTLVTPMGTVEIQLRCSHRNEFLLMEEEFGSVENVTFVNEETLTHENEEVSEVDPEDRLNEVMLGNGTTLDVRSGDAYTTGPDGTRWQITSNNASFTPSNYSMGVDAYDDRTNPGIMERIRQAGNTFMASQSQDFRVSDLVDSQIRQYPVTPNEAYLFEEQNDVSPGFEDLDADEERPEASNEDTPIDELPVWANEENFTHNS